MELFPTDYGCFTDIQYKTTAPLAKRYLGDKADLDNYIQFKANYLFNSETDLDLFYQWWVGSINNGSDSFDIRMPYMGVSRSFTVKFMKGFDPTFSDGSHTATLEFQGFIGGAA